MNQTHVNLQPYFSFHHPMLTLIVTETASFVYTSKYCMCAKQTTFWYWWMWLVYPSKETISQTNKGQYLSRHYWQKHSNPLQLAARLVIALFMVVIISSKVRTVAYCNYTCAAISVWMGMWVESCGKYSEKNPTFVCGCGCMCVGCAVIERKNNFILLRSELMLSFYQDNKTKNIKQLRLKRYIYIFV